MLLLTFNQANMLLPYEQKHDRSRKNTLCLMNECDK